MADEWGVARRTVRRYLDRAAGRNRELIAKAPADALADSVAFWRGLLLDAMDDRDAARAGLPAATGREADRLAKRAADAERRAATCRDRLDRLLGLLAPAAAADRLTVAGGGPTAPRAPEPADPDRAVRDLLNAAGVVAEFVPPVASPLTAPAAWGWSKRRARSPCYARRGGGVRVAGPNDFGNTGANGERPWHAGTGIGTTRRCRRRTARRSWT